MKITHSKSGKNYQLYPDTKIKIERTNPFFNEYGEQSLPISLPASPYNELILGNPSNVSNKGKLDSLIDCSLTDGAYYMRCRQAILNVTPGQDISTSFYINEGSFYSKLEKTYLTDIFGDETIANVDSVSEAVAYLKNLNSNGGDERFSVFQVLLDEDDNGSKRYLNGTISSGGFINEKVTSEILSGKVITVPIGFYMTPFIKVNYLLNRIFSFFGYTLLDNFFSNTYPFTDMVLINNVADAIVTGTIRIGQLVPKKTCSEFLDLMRKKFCCEFVTDEVANTVSILLFDEVNSLNPSVDLSNNAIGQPTIEFSDYQQVLLKPAKILDSEVDEMDSLELISGKYTDAYWSNIKGCLIRTGYQLKVIPFIQTVTEVLTPVGQQYCEGSGLEEYEIEIPECVPGHDLYIGDVQFLNSSIVSAGTSDETTNSSSELSFMLCFSVKHELQNNTLGSITNSVVVRDTPSILPFVYKFSDYSLSIIGPDGIFEKFYRGLDTLKRNSLHKVKRKFLLSESQKSSIPSHMKIVVNSSEFYIDKLNYYIGGKNEPVESELLTTQLYTPISVAKSFSEVFRPLPTDYVWISHYELEPLSENDYSQHPYKDASNPIFFPPRASKELVGRKFNEIYKASPYDWDDDGQEPSRYKHALCYSWMECVPATP